MCILIVQKYYEFKQLVICLAKFEFLSLLNFTADTAESSVMKLSEELSVNI